MIPIGDAPVLARPRFHDRGRGHVSGRCRHFSVSPAVLRFEDPQETALLLADAPRTRATAGAERNDARSGSSLAKEFAILRMQASARPRLASAGLSSFVCRYNCHAVAWTCQAATRTSNFSTIARAC